MIESDARNISRIIEFSCALAEMIAERDITPEEIRRDRFTQWAVTTPLYNIGEFTSHVSRELRMLHPEIPWSRAAGLRHRLVHDYEGTNWDIVVEVVFCDIPAYAAQLEALLEAEGI